MNHNITVTHSTEALFLDIHGIRVNLLSADPRAVKEIRSNFRYFLVSGGAS